MYICLEFFVALTLKCISTCYRARFRSKGEKGKETSEFLLSQSIKVTTHHSSHTNHPRTTPPFEIQTKKGRKHRIFLEDTSPPKRFLAVFSCLSCLWSWPFGSSHFFRNRLSSLSNYHSQIRHQFYHTCVNSSINDWILSNSLHACLNQRKVVEIREGHRMACGGQVEVPSLPPVPHLSNNSLSLFLLDKDHKRVMKHLCLRVIWCKTSSRGRI